MDLVAELLLKGFHDAVVLCDTASHHHVVAHTDAVAETGNAARDGLVDAVDDVALVRAHGELRDDLALGKDRAGRADTDLLGRLVAKAGQEKMGIALMKLAEEDPTFKTYTDEETGQTIIAGMGELHLEIIVDRLLREYKVEANVGAPQVAYKETITKAVDQDTKYARQSGGKGQYGHVKIHVEPNESGKGYEFVNALVGGAIPKEYVPAIDAGIQGAMLSGVLAGYPVVDVKVTLYDGSYHEVDSSEMAFKIAGSMAFKEACQKAGPTLLEPIMKVCVIVPDEYMGDVIGDLNSRRGQIQGFEARSGAQQIDAFVPLAEMFGYATDLRSCTQGRGQYTMEPAHYIEIPKNIQEKIINQRTNRA